NYDWAQLTTQGDTTKRLLGEDVTGGRTLERTVPFDASLRAPTGEITDTKAQEGGDDTC
ncbi:12743_t:CDS:2, partial [Racocetra fulgida]